MCRHTKRTGEQPPEQDDRQEDKETKPYSRNAKALYPLVGHTISRRTNSPTKTTGMSDHGNPGRRKTGPQHTVSDPTKKKENQGWVRQAQGTLRLSTQKVLAQDEEDRPPATVSIIQARRELSGDQDTAAAQT